MAFLAPFFLAGLAAVALPVLLHLRRNRPKETVAFSSLMFLEESPPVTKTRSRLQDILLLILRCLAIALLILAFTRPFFPAENPPTANADGAAMNFILIDTSASMRGEAFSNAIKAAEDLIGGLPGEDWIAVAGFSNQLRPLLNPARARNLAAGERKPAALAVLPALKPDWESTSLASSLLAAVAAAGDETNLKIHLVGDLQKGSALERLRGEIWPGTVQIIPHPVTPELGWTNAGIHILPLENQVQRARITNSEGSEKSDFSLIWSGIAEPVRITVPPGESAVIDAPTGLSDEGILTLTGDDFDYDNEVSWVTPVRPVSRVWYPEQSLSTDSTEGAYFLARALQSTPDYSVEITAMRPAELPVLTIVSNKQDVATVLAAGGNVLFTVRDTESVQALAEILATKSAEAREANVKDHVLFGEIDFKSTVFSPFADARYADFSSIRVWKYRVLPENLTAKANIIARFDSGDPAWMVFSVGKGTLHVLTTTWRPADSQLALTTKFPPLLHGLLAQAMDKNAVLGPIPVDGAHPAPGIHRDGSTIVSVQLDPAESERTPLPESELRSLGLPLDPPKDLARSAELAKELSNEEQESRQRIAWWLLVAAAGFFLAETILAARNPHPITT